MNDFDGLLPARRPLPEFPDPGADRAVSAASSRRRRRLVAGAVAVAAVAVSGGLAAAGPGGGASGLRIDPANRPSPNRPLPSASGPARAVPTPGVAGQPAPSPTVSASLPVPPSVPPSIPPRHSPSPSPAPARTGRPATYSTSVVADRATEECTRRLGWADGRSLCYRYLGPLTAKSGEGVTLTYEYCAQSGDVTLHLTGQETTARIEDDAQAWSGTQPNAPAAHDRTIALGTCVRYVTGWDGLDDAGRPLRPGRYAVEGDLNERDRVNTVTGYWPAFDVT